MQLKVRRGSISLRALLLLLTERQIHSELLILQITGIINTIICLLVPVAFIVIPQIKKPQFLILQDKDGVRKA